MRLILTIVSALTAVGCRSPADILDDWGTAGYATVEGAIVRVSGESFEGDVWVSCGLDAPGFFGGPHATDSPGHYTAEMAWPDATWARKLEERGWKAICAVSAYDVNGAFATATDTVLFAPTRSTQASTTIDLIERADRTP